MQVDNNERLLNIINRQTLKYVGQVARSDGLGKYLIMGIMGMVYGKRKRGRPETRYSDKIRELRGMSMVQVVRKAGTEPIYLEEICIG